MSRNSKNARNIRRKQSFKRAETVGTQTRSTGNKGPAKTSPKHGKKATWYNRKDGKINTPEPKAKETDSGEE
jgi:hypothetical protein